ncbi:MAG: epoxyqueuosine reductase [Bacillota bacterium]
MITADPGYLAEEIKKVITGFVEKSPRNYCWQLGERYFDQPLVGFARGDDPVFDIIKEQVGPKSMTPCDAMTNSLQSRGFTGQIKPGEVSVVSWVLPISRAVREKNRLQKTEPAAEWAYTRYFGEELNNDLRRRVVGWFESRGHLAAAPMLLPGFSIIKNDPARRGFTSTWSERHTAYACGLGTFSLNDALITERGIAHRLGSVVVMTALPEAVRPYRGHMDYCLSARGCGGCIKRCPMGAISDSGHDKVACSKMTYESEAAAERRKRFGVEKTGCGLCQVGVPCEDRIPKGAVKG